NERRLRAVEPAARESEVHLETGAVLVGIEAELPELGLNALLEDALHRALGAQPITDQVRDGADLELVAARELLQLRAARHAAVVVHHFAQHAHGLQTRQTAQVQRRLGMPGAYQHSAAARAQREDVPGTGEVGSRRGLVRQDEVALVLAVLVVDDDDHASGAQLAEDLFDGIDGRWTFGRRRALAGK